MKHQFVQIIEQVIEVALRVRAWIETVRTKINGRRFYVALRVRAWIETYALSSAQSRHLGRPPREGVD